MAVKKDDPNPQLPRRQLFMKDSPTTSDPKPRIQDAVGQKVVTPEPAPHEEPKAKSKGGRPKKEGAKSAAERKRASRAKAEA